MHKPDILGHMGRDKRMAEDNLSSKVQERRKEMGKVTRPAAEPELNFQKKDGDS